MQKWKLYIKIGTNFLILILCILFILFLLPKLFRFFLPILIGWIVSVIANPLVRFLEQKVKIVRKLSSALLIIITMAAVIGALYGLTNIFIKEIVELSNDLPLIVEKMSDSTTRVLDKLNKVYSLMPSFLKINLGTGDFSEIQESLNGSISSYLTIDNASSIAKNVAEWAFYFIISILFAYFFIAERDKIVASVKKVCPKAAMEYFDFVMNGFKTAVGGYFKAQLKIMLIMIVILFAGLEILGVSYSFLLALGVAILDILPFLGTGFILWPWALSDFLLGNYFRAVGLIVIYVLCQVIKQVLQPKMVGDSVGMSPLSTLLYMFIGYKVMGVIGMIIGIPIGMIVINLYRIGLFDRAIRGVKIVMEDINEFRKF